MEIKITKRNILINLFYLCKLNFDKLEFEPNTKTKINFSTIVLKKKKKKNTL